MGVGLCTYDASEEVAVETTMTQACGLINDHLVSCFRHRECREAFSDLPWS